MHQELDKIHSSPYTDKRLRKVATYEEVLIGMVSFFAIGFLIGYVIGLKALFFANPYVKECFEENKYL